jgi:mycofactocin precursor
MLHRVPIPREREEAGVAKLDLQVVQTPAAEASLDAERDAGPETESAQENVLNELLVEEVSIDGMCGVY